MSKVSSRAIVGALVVVALATTASALVFMPKTPEVVVMPDASAAQIGSVVTLGASTAVLTMSTALAEPQIPAELQSHAEFIRARWVDGPNLAERYIQFTVKCSARYDCLRLIISDAVTGELVDTGMGDSDMPNLAAYSTVDSARIVISWENVAGANCARAAYRWTGRELAAESDILEFEYTDAGCDRMGGEGIPADD